MSSLAGQHSDMSTKAVKSVAVIPGQTLWAVLGSAVVSNFLWRFLSHYFGQRSDSERVVSQLGMFSNIRRLMFRTWRSRLGLGLGISPVSLVPSGNAGARS